MQVKTKKLKSCSESDSGSFQGYLTAEDQWRTEQWGHPVSVPAVCMRLWSHVSVVLVPHWCWLEASLCWDFTKHNVMLPPFVLPVPKSRKSCHSLGLAKVSVCGYCPERQCWARVAASGVLSQLPVAQGFLHPGCCQQLLMAYFLWIYHYYWFQSPDLVSFHHISLQRFPHLSCPFSKFTFFGFIKKLDNAKWENQLWYFFRVKSILLWVSHQIDHWFHSSLSGKWCILLNDDEFTIVEQITF